MREDSTPFLAVLAALLLLAAASAYVLRVRYVQHSPKMLSQPLPQLQQKQSRSKERRRRGKVPFKDILKANKKANKLIARLDKPSISEPDPPLPDEPSTPTYPDASESPLTRTSSQSSDDPNLDPPSPLASQPSDPVPQSPSNIPSPSHSLSSFPLNEPPAITTSTSMPAYSSQEKPSADLRRPRLQMPTQKYNGTWENHGSSTHETTYQKPPRFRSQSRVSSSSSITGPMAFAMSFPIPSSSSPPVGPIHDPSRSFRFPSLNSPMPLPTDSPPAPVVNEYADPSPSNTSHPHTPLNNVGSTLTTDSSQASSELTSIKAALEASRMREGKYKQEAEHYAKECETLRWRWAEDTTLLRRREAELQHQVTVLMHQLQAYATAAYMSHSYTSTSSRRPGTAYVPHPFTPTSPPVPMHPPSSGPASPVQQQQQQQQTTTTTRTPSPFIAYAPSQPQPQPQTPTQQQSKLLSLFPVSPTNAGAMPPVVTPGGGSPRSPQLLDTSSSPLGARGRRRKRVSIAQEDGWVVSAYEEEGKGEEEEDGEENRERPFEREGVSELLADAVLKRPESLRATPRSKPLVGEGNSPKMEFTFPSIAVKEDDGFWEGDKEEDVFRVGE